MFLVDRLKRNFRPLIRYLKFKILHIDDSPKSIARGVAVGLFVAWTPFLGLHIVISLLLASILKANKVAAMLFVWVSNAATLIIVYYPAYLLGRFILSLFRDEMYYSLSQIKRSFSQISDSGSILSDIFTTEFWMNFSKFFFKIGLELTVGGFVIGLIMGVIGYFTTYRLILWHRQGRPHRRYRRHQ